MGVGRSADDWQVCGICQIAAGDVIAAGGFVFDFYSETAAITARMIFSGPGAGLGGNASGTGLPVQGASFGPWSSIECDKSFSILDLNGAWGRLTSANIGVPITFGAVIISAFPAWSLWDCYFHSQNVGGFGTGLGAGAMVIGGKWYLWSIVYNTPNSGGSSSSTEA